MMFDMYIWHGGFFYKPPYYQYIRSPDHLSVYLIIPFCSEYDRKTGKSLRLILKKTDYMEKKKIINI
jgi:hypothetical protein